MQNERFVKKSRYGYTNTTFLTDHLFSCVINAQMTNNLTYETL